VIVWPDHSGWHGLEFCVVMLWVGSDQIAGAGSEIGLMGHGCEARVTETGEAMTRATLPVLSRRQEREGRADRVCWSWTH
jgi:hypothetical protein